MRHIIELPETTVEYNDNIREDIPKMFGLPENTFTRIMKKWIDQSVDDKVPMSLLFLRDLKTGTLNTTELVMLTTILINHSQLEMLRAIEKALNEH